MKKVEEKKSKRNFPIYLIVGFIMIVTICLIVYVPKNPAKTANQFIKIIDKEKFGDMQKYYYFNASMTSESQEAYTQTIKSNVFYFSNVSIVETVSDANNATATLSNGKKIYLLKANNKWYIDAQATANQFSAS